MSKMYIAVKDSAPTGLGVVAVAHAAVATFLTFQDTPAMPDWVTHSFKHVVYRVSDGQFEALKEQADHVIITESAWAGQEIAIGFKPRPREDWAPIFQCLSLYK